MIIELTKTKLTHRKHRVSTEKFSGAACSLFPVPCSLKKGSALVYGLIILSMVSVLMTSLITFIASQTKYSLRTVSREQAFQTAEAGVSFYRWYLAHSVEGKTAQQIKAFWETGNPYGVAAPYEAEYTDPNGAAIGKYRIEVTPPDTGSTIVTVQSTGWTYKYPDTIRVLKVRFRRPSWSEYAVLANDFMRFGQGTETYGKIHSNNGIRFDGVAHNVVTSALEEYDDPDHTDNNDEFAVHTHVNPPPGSGINNSFRPLEGPPNTMPSRPDVFEAGRTLLVPNIGFTGVLADLGLMKDEADTGNGKYFDDTGEGRRIILKSSGSYDVCTVNNFSTTTNGITNYLRNSGSGTCNSCSGQCLSTYTIPDNSVIFVEDNVWLEGQISDKRVTIVAANLLSSTKKDLFIRDNILYTNYDGSDVLGLIGQRHVETILSTPNVLRIDGALLAQEGRVGRQHYGDVRSTITVYGSIATYQRYGFAWTDGTGYQIRNLYYDNNLLYYPPPFFPTGTQYLMDLWEEL